MSFICLPSHNILDSRHTGKQSMENFLLFDWQTRRRHGMRLHWPDNPYRDELMNFHGEKQTLRKTNTAIKKIHLFYCAFTLEESQYWCCCSKAFALKIISTVIFLTFHWFKSVTYYTCTSLCRKYSFFTQSSVICTVHVFSNYLVLFAFESLIMVQWFVYNSTVESETRLTLHNQPF